MGAFAVLRLTLQRLVTSQSRRALLLEGLVRAERKLPASRSVPRQILGVHMEGAKSRRPVP
jgi:hypothetical protein